MDVPFLLNTATMAQKQAQPQARSYPPELLEKAKQIEKQLKNTASRGRLDQKNEQDFLQSLLDPTWKVGLEPRP